MKISHTILFNHLDELYSEQDYIFVTVDQVLRSGQVQKFCKAASRAGKYVILGIDSYKYKVGKFNSDLEKLQRCALMIEASEIVIPDHPNDSADQVLEHIDIALTQVNLPLHTRVMAVPRGKDLNEYLECAEFIEEEYPQIGTFGIPFNIVNKVKIERSFLVGKLRIRGIELDVHFLGEDKNLETLKDPYLHREVRGLNTSKLLNWVMHGDAASSTYTPSYEKRQPAFERYKLTSDQMKLAKEQFEYWSDFCALG